MESEAEQRDERRRYGAIGNEAAGTGKEGMSNTRIKSAGKGREPQACLSKTEQKIYDAGTKCGFCRHWGACRMQCRTQKERTK